MGLGEKPWKLRVQWSPLNWGASVHRRRPSGGNHPGPKARLFVVTGVFTRSAGAL
jgi:hypothetical protein